MKIKTQFKQLLLLLLVFTFSTAIAFGQNCGDINTDGSTDIVDALLVAQCYVGLTSCLSADISDVNCDGSVDIVDGLLIAQLYVGLIDALDCCGPTPTDPPPTDPPGEDVTLEMQAEDATFDGDVESDHAGYTGSGYVNTPNAVGQWIEWTISVDRDCNAVCVFTYATSGSGRAMDLSVNGNAGPSLSFPDTGAWTNWSTETANIILNNGPNAIRLTATSSGGAPNMDKMDITIKGGGVVTPTPTPSPTPTGSPTPTLGPGETPIPVNVERPRIIATTDGETDDRSTFVRFLMYATDYDIEGIIQVNSRYQRSGHSKDKWIETALGYYDEVLPNLRLHNQTYPNASDILDVMRVGNENSSDLYVDPPDMDTKNTAGEQYIINKLLDDDPRPIHIPSWGGANTTASALWRLKTEYSQADFLKAVSKVRIYCIWYQDGGGQWIEDNIPEAYIFEAFGWDNTWDYQSTSGDNPSEVRAYMTSSWCSENVKQNHGPLGAYTPQSYISEGDTPSWLNLINNGLRAHEDYTLGGWGGRGLHTISSKPNYLTDDTIKEDTIKKKHYWRWIIDCQNDFEARMDWCVQPYSGANHPPAAVVTGNDYYVVPGGLGLNVSPGQMIFLDGSGSSDPDGDNLSYEWWQYYQKDSVDAQISISNSTFSNASFTVPNESGKQIEIILSVKDNGSPNLKAYQRLIFDIH